MNTKVSNFFSIYFGICVIINIISIIIYGDVEIIKSGNINEKASEKKKLLFVNTAKKYNKKFVMNSNYRLYNITYCTITPPTLCV